MEERHFGPLHFLPGDRNGKYPHCHSVFVEGAGILIDPASSRDRLDRLAKAGDVREVWLSHWHEDHFMHLDLFEELPLRISEEDAPPLADIETLLDWYGLEGDAYRTYWRNELLGRFHYRSRKPAGYLCEGRRFSSGAVAIEILATPGHTPGHLAFHFPEEGVLFLGDYDLSPFGPWYGDRYSSIDDTLASLSRLKRMPVRVLLTGHEKGIFEEPFPENLWQKYEDVIRIREERLIDALKEPLTLDEIARLWIVYGRSREPKEFFVFGEKAIMGKHVERLLRAAVVIRSGDRYVLT
jgi:glyoxylase-like metal-dependent hydrolase (beta-lactamase superfamily II)